MIKMYYKLGIKSLLESILAENLCCKIYDKLILINVPSHILHIKIHFTNFSKFRIIEEMHLYF